LVEVATGTALSASGLASVSALEKVVEEGIPTA
jgi:hypothetical protein